MKTSDSIAKIAPALLQAQRAIEFATKSAVNAHLKNRYADLSDVIEAIKPALNDAGIYFMQTPTDAELGTVRLTTRLMHESGEWIEDTMTIPCLKTDPQGTGSAITYARRYALAAITGLYQDDDDGQGAQYRPKQNSQQGAQAQGRAPQQGQQQQQEQAQAGGIDWSQYNALPALVGAFNALPAEERPQHQAAFDARRKELMGKGSTPKGAAATRRAVGAGE